jgi:hypothetical protein
VPSSFRVLRFEITHFPKLNSQDFDADRVGILGRNSFSVHEDDEVTVQAVISEPAFAYLIAFRPDGTDELCDPDTEGARPISKTESLYPPPSKHDMRIRLSEGAGLHAFALVMSRQPLPSYREWKQQHWPPPWSARLPGKPGIVWRDDSQDLRPLLADDRTSARGKDVKARVSGSPSARLATWLRGLPGVDLVTLEAFPVEPATGP